MRGAEVKLQSGAVFATDYRILGQLDEGGMGLLYRAEQLSTGEERALKVLKPSLLADGISRERFNQEATIGANIPSDHIVKVIGAGIDDDTGIPWIAMELLRGDNLHRVVRAKGALPMRDVHEIFSQLCHALGAAHRGGVVHRDLKPENIFIARAQRTDAKTTVKLLDFGIAKVVQEYETSVAATAIVGSPLWMAPEQVRMGRIRPATDVWALGLLAFWMLTGKYYWRAAQTRAVGQAESLLHEKLYEPIEAASKRAEALGVADKLPPDFDEWFRRCVARDPEDRFPDASHAFEALHTVLTTRRSPWRARIRGAGIGATVASALLAGVWVLASHGTTPSIAARPVRGVANIARPSIVEEHHAPISVSVLAPPVAPVAPPHTIAASPPSPRVVHEASESRVHVTPEASGYVFRAHTQGGSMRCTDRAHSRAWEVTPDWASSLEARIRARENTLRTERLMAQRSPTPEILAQLTQDERLLAQDRTLVAAQIERSVPAERSRSATLAQGSRCVDEGLHVDGTAVYAVWCCP